MTPTVDVTKCWHEHEDNTVCGRGPLAWIHDKANPDRHSFKQLRIVDTEAKKGRFRLIHFILAVGLVVWIAVVVRQFFVPAP